MDRKLVTILRFIAAPVACCVSMWFINFATNVGAGFDSSDRCENRTGIRFDKSSYDGDLILPRLRRTPEGVASVVFEVTAPCLVMSVKSVVEFRSSEAPDVIGSITDLGKTQRDLTRFRLLVPLESSVHSDLAVIVFSVVLETGHVFSIAQLFDVQGTHAVPDARPVAKNDWWGTFLMPNHIERGMRDN